MESMAVAMYTVRHKQHTTDSPPSDSRKHDAPRACGLARRAGTTPFRDRDREQQARR
jgi:hypothetical protein